MSSLVENYFGPVEENNETKYIPPDYENEVEEELDDDSSGFDDSPTEEDEGIIETLEDEKHKTERKEMISTPFSDPGSSAWGNSGQNQPNSPWSSQQNSGSPIWQQSRPSWGSSSPSWGSSFGGSGTVGNQKEQIPRQKKVIFCDFLDCMMETYQSNGLPGLRPRGLYDLKPRFNVWEKLMAFNPQKIFALIPPNTINTINGSSGWDVTLAYWCCALSDFLGIPFTNCQVLSQSQVGQPKELAILQAIQQYSIPKTDIVYVGIYSGVSGQSDKDKNAARVCEIDYIDLNTLLNSMV
jgi:hypothetical protein